MDEDAYPQVKETDYDFLLELAIMRRESASVEAAVQYLASVTLINGVGFAKYRQDVNGTTERRDTIEENVPDDLMRWATSLSRRFLTDVLAHLSCYGFVAFITDPGTMDAFVIDVTRLRIRLSQTTHGRLKYNVTIRDDMHGMRKESDPLVHFYVEEEFDWMTGRCRGRLAVCYNEYKSMMILLRNRLVINTGNAQPVFVMEHTDRRQVSDTINALTPVVNDFDLSIPGINVSARDRLAARSKVAESIRLDDQVAATRMEKTAVATLPGIWTAMEVAAINPVAASFVPAPVGRSVVQRNYAPESPQFANDLILFNRMIAAVFQVPCQITERGVGHTAETLDQEMDMLKRTGQRYGVHLHEVLNIVSSELLDPIALEAYAEEHDARVRRKRKNMHMDSEDTNEDPIAVELLHEIVHKIGIVRMRLVPAVEFREELQLFENHMLTWDAMKDVLVRSQRSLYGRLEKEDPRIKIARLGGPGRHGASTLGDARHDSQRGSRGYTSEREPAKPGEK